MNPDLTPGVLPSRGWSRHAKGYLMYTSRKKNPAVKRGQLLHRAIIEAILGAAIPPGLHVTHLWPFNKQTRLPHELMVAPPEFNPSPSRRCPYTGHFLSADQWQRRFGVNWAKGATA
jgi:hypothetical protein